jgi:hypothetical protein
MFVKVSEVYTTSIFRKTEAVVFSKTLINIRKAIWSQNPEDQNTSLGGAVCIILT